MGESWPDGAALGAFSMFFISISSWWIHRSGGLRSFWLPFLLLALWLALFLRETATAAAVRNNRGETAAVLRRWRPYFLCWAEERRVQMSATTTTTTTTVTAPTETMMMTRRLLFFWGVALP